MPANDYVTFRNGQALDRSRCPIISFDDFRSVVVREVSSGARLSALFVLPWAESDSAKLMAVLARPAYGELRLLSCDVGESYPALTPDCPSAHWFEREIFEQWNIRPEGHPWLKPIRFQPSRCSAKGDAGLVAGIGEADFFGMEGDEVHEVAVGPVHAGVIEPGHFRFQCHGETVHHLEISLGYQHRGVERAVVGGPGPRTRHYMETIAGDTTIGHTTAYCMAVEGLSGVRPSARAETIRTIGAELERIANHVGDLGALVGDVGYLPTMSYCGRIRGDVLNVTALLCGNRFGRGLITVGGVGHDVDEAIASEALRRLEEIERDTNNAVSLMFETPSVLARLEGTGEVSEQLAKQIGLVGVAARASDIPCDVRHEFPYGLYQFTQMPVCTWSTGDCFARGYIRWLEIGHSIAFIMEHLRSLPSGAIRQETRELQPDRIVVALTEGWRGEICHVAMTDDKGCFAAYKIVDPSFHNWFGLACALREQQISDFPLCNKSFNLSYCGHDL